MYDTPGDHYVPVGVGCGRQRTGHPCSRLEHHRSSMGKLGSMTGAESGAVSHTPLSILALKSRALYVG